MFRMLPDYVKNSSAPIESKGNIGVFTYHPPQNNFVFFTPSSQVDHFTSSVTRSSDIQNTSAGVPPTTITTNSI